MPNILWSCCASLSSAGAGERWRAAKGVQPWRVGVLAAKTLQISWPSPLVIASEGFGGATARPIRVLLRLECSSLAESNRPK